VSPEAFASLVGLAAGKAISRDAAREVLTRLVAEGGDPQAIVKAENLQAVSDGLAEFVRQAIAADPEAAEKVRAGNMKAIGPLVGGAIINGFPWNSVFWVNVPIGIAGVVMGTRWLLNYQTGERRP